ncbi:unnamed protein product [Brachionus calyciflorus]|uniref:Jagunal n=1 Tax=Brachionus calyciflorus TaxID=104777 RepID=A0A814F4A2_9BILA|nr:unnamed protein product [Brachionus calyciflorus]
MASRGGTSRPVGTDGTDYMHREKVASQYAISAETKKFVRYSIWMHLMMSFIIIVQIIFYFSNKYLSAHVEFPEVPKPNLWEYIWLLSLIPAAAGYMSLNRSRTSLLKFYYIGTVVLGLGPILSTMLFNASDLLEYAQTKQTSNSFHNFPVIVFWYMYLFIVVQIHAFGIYFARILLKVWSKDNKKRK